MSKILCKYSFFFNLIIIESILNYYTQNTKRKFKFKELVIGGVMFHLKHNRLYKNLNDKAHKGQFLNKFSCQKWVTNIR